MNVNDFLDDDNDSNGALADYPVVGIMPYMEKMKRKESVSLDKELYDAKKDQPLPTVIRSPSKQLPSLKKSDPIGRFISWNYLRQHLFKRNGQRLSNVRL